MLQLRHHVLQGRVGNITDEQVMLRMPVGQQRRDQRLLLNLLRRSIRGIGYHGPCSGFQLPASRFGVSVTHRCMRPHSGFQLPTPVCRWGFGVSGAGIRGISDHHSGYQLPSLIDSARQFKYLASLIHSLTLNLTIPLTPELNSQLPRLARLKRGLARGAKFAHGAHPGQQLEPGFGDVPTLSTSLAFVLPAHT